MKVKKVHLKNGYKRFHDLTIDLGDDPKRIIALVGPNGCGKSSVLDGILFHANAYARVGNTASKDYFYHSMNQEPNFDYKNVQVELIDGKFVEVFGQKKELGKESTIFSFRSSYRYNNNLKVKEVKATSEIRLNSYGASSASDLDSKMEENYRRLNAKYNKYLHDEDCRPSEAKQKIIGDLNNSFTECLNLEISSIGNIEASKGTLYFKKSDHPTEFEFNVLSSGEKEVVDILLDLYLRQDEYNDTVFLLDEPELHINTAIQKNLLLEINRLVGDNCQIWLTTHSIGFLRALQGELREQCQIIRFEEDMNLGSTARVMTPVTKTVSVWRDIFEIALDDLAHLVSPETIIFCEGRDTPRSDGEERGFDAKVFNNIFSENYQDTLFVSSGGNTELDQRSEIAFTILSKALPRLKILVIKDRDVSSGRENDENDRQVYLQNNPQNFRILRRWELENYLFDKEVLTKYCLGNQLVFQERDYDEFVTDIVNQNLKDETGRIKNFCGITTSVNAETFKINLSKYISKDMAVYRELEDCIFKRL